MTTTAAELAQQLGIDTKGRTSGNVHTICPKCSHTRRKNREPCLSVNLDNDVPVYLCHHCGWRGPEAGFAAEHQLTHWSQPERRQRREYTRPEEPVAHPSTRLETFFSERGIRRETYEAFGIIDDGRSICFPYYRGGQLVNIKHREPQKRFRMEAGAELVMWGLDDIDPDQPVTIVEGECDRLALAEAGIGNVLSVPAGAPAVGTDIENAELAYLESAETILKQAREVILAGDMDEPGRRLTEELARRIGRAKCWRVEWPDGAKDANDALVAGGAEAVIAAIDRRIPYPVDGVTSPSEYLELLWKYESDVETGKSLSAWPGFSTMMRFTPGQLTVLAGIPSAGKSVWLNHLLLQLGMEHGWRSALFSPEYHPTELHVRDLLELHMGKPIRQDLPGAATRDDVRAALADIEDKFRFIHPTAATLDEVLGRAEALVYRHGVKMLVIDPWTELDRGDDGALSATDWVGKSLKRIRRFGREFGVHCIVSAHPAKSRPIEQKDGTRRYPVITPYDISDSRHWYEMADNILSIWRDKTDPTAPVEIHVQKVRFRDNGQMGVAAFHYTPLTRYYTDVTERYEDDLELEA